MHILTLSPVHIGTGQELMKDIDYVVHNGKTYRLDPDAIGEALLIDEAGRLREKLATTWPGQLLQDSDYARADLFRYVIPGEPRSQKEGAALRECIKTHDDRPYLPGSSIKGALRTALGWTAWSEVRPRLDKAAFGRNKSWAGQNLERQIFGPDPNHDLLRALHVGDAFGPGPGEALMLANAQVVTRRNLGSPIEVEAIREETRFSGRLTIDESLFTPGAEKVLQLGQRGRWLDELAQRVRRHAQARIEALRAWFEKSELGKGPAGYYRQLGEIVSKLPDNRFVLQLGGGTGWDRKTFTTHLHADQNLFEWLVREYRMTIKGAAARKPGDPFPRSRRALVRGGRVDAPFGWVLVELQPQGER